MWKISEIAALFDIKINSNEVINVVTTDSRKAKDALFVPVKGENFDGNDFAIDAVKNGAKFAITNKDLSGDGIIKIQSEVNPLHVLARYKRDMTKAKIIGITGSCGKTSLRHSLSQILERKFKISSTFGNFNNDVGMPLCLCNIDDEAEFGVYEIGTNHHGEIKALTDILEPNIAIITNIGHSHIENFGTQDAIAQEKSDIFFNKGRLEKIIINKNDKYFEFLKKRGLQKGLKEENIISFGTELGADIYAQRNATNQVLINVFGKKCIFDADTEFVNNDSFYYNIAAICGVLYVIGVDIKEVFGSKIHYELPHSRCEILKLNYLGKNLTIMDDSYNASPDSMKNGMKYLYKMAGNARKVLVLGDMFELGQKSRELHECLSDEASKANLVFCVGQNMKYLYDSLLNSIKGGIFANSIDASMAIPDLLKDGDFVLVKGSRGMKVETIIKKIQENDVAKIS